MVMRQNKNSQKCADKEKDFIVVLEGMLSH